MRVISFDLETHQIVKGKMLVPKGVVLSYFEASMASGELLLFQTPALDWLEGWLHDKDAVLLGHNVAYDLAVCAQERPRLLPLIFEAYEQGRIRDTMVRGKLIDIARGNHKFRTVLGPDGRAKRAKSDHTLAGMSALYLGEPLKKGEDTWRTRYHELDGMPLAEWPEDAREYSRKDAEVTWRVYEAQEKSLALPPFKGVLPNELEQTKAAWPLHLMSCWGVRTDLQAVKVLRERLEKELDGAHDFMVGAGLLHQSGSKKNPKWTKDLAAIRDKVKCGFEAQGLVPPKTDTGLVQTDYDAKIGSCDPDLKKYAVLSLTETLLTSFVPVLERGTNAPICARFNVLVESGRISCSDPNLLNPPATAGGEVRECFVPRPGNVFISADYSVIELRALAYICLELFGESGLAKVFERGEDPHSNLARVMGFPTEDDATVTINGKLLSVRRFMKATNFGFSSGLGEDTFIEYARGYDIHLDKKQAHEAREAFFRADPSIKRYFEHVGRLVPNDNATIRQYVSGRIRGGCRFTSAVNTQFQGLVADGAKEAHFMCCKEAYVVPDSSLFGCRPFNFLYDEFIFEAPESRASEAANRLVALMQAGMEKWIKRVPIKVSNPVLMRRWSKKAKSKRLESGKWSVWE